MRLALVPPDHGGQKSNQNHLANLWSQYQTILFRFFTSVPSFGQCLSHDLFDIG